eukprot:TRINITY_DN2800_c0_g1_i1.p1 TRINITY_DN2800_c0_g1~~TRINITY_DN2800_c0_g1_i1.p1  ORF type:complete len:325 (-),score=52.44 TRINITY_DN2800_c0_g1_i1:29-1003(-)
MSKVYVSDDEKIAEWLKKYSIKYEESMEVLNLTDTYKNIEIPRELGDCFSGKVLKKMDLRCNKLKEIPESIGMIETLENLCFNQNMIEVCPKSIGELRNLRELYLNENKLKFLPEEICTLSLLAKLYIHSNEILDFPGGIGMGLTSLTELGYSDNGLFEIPLEVCQIGSLRKLDCSYNNLKYIPEIISNLGELRTLDVSYNELDQFPEGIMGLDELKSFYVNGNNFRAIIEDIGVLEKLEKFRFGENEELNVFPEAISRLTSLRRLGFQEIIFGRIPDTIFKNMFMLKEIYCEKEHIIELKRLTSDIETIEHIGPKFYYDQGNM